MEVWLEAGATTTSGGILKSLTLWNIRRLGVASGLPPKTLRAYPTVWTYHIGCSGRLVELDGGFLILSFGSTKLLHRLLRSV